MSVNLFSFFSENKKKKNKVKFMRLKTIFEQRKSKLDYEIYHNSYSSAVQTAKENVENRGFIIDDEDWFQEVTTGSRKPAIGETIKIQLPLYKEKDGELKETKKFLNIQVYALPKSYELNMYIS